MGKIAQVTPQVVYLNLGATHGIRDGEELSVFRNKGKIVDPDTGEVLAIQRPLVAKLRVSEVNEKFSKAKIVGELEVTLEIGDEVEPTRHGLIVAVAPVLFEDGTLTNVGAGISEDVTTKLVQRGVKVVERSVLDKVLRELLVQNTLLFDEKSSQQFGKLTGANVVLAGKIVPNRNLGKTYLRLIDVQTGEILFAVGGSVNLVNAARVRPGMSSFQSNRSKESNISSQSLGARRNSGSAALGTARTLPSFSTTSGRYERIKGKGIRLNGYQEYNPRGTSTVQTKSSDLLTKDFTFEVKLTFEPGHRIAYIGLGYGKPDRSYNGYTDSIYLRFHAPEHGDGLVDVTGYRKGNDGMGKVPHGGTHTVRIIKEGESVTFHVDPESDGPTEDDLELTIPNIRTHAPFFNSKNMPLFFGGSGVYSHATLQVGKAIYPSETAGE